MEIVKLQMKYKAHLQQSICNTLKISRISISIENQVWKVIHKTPDAHFCSLTENFNFQKQKKVLIGFPD